MKILELPSLEKLQSEFLLDHGRGVLMRRRPRGRYMGVTGTKMSCGYVRVRINQGFYLAHRVIYAIANGVLPTKLEQIDHVNGKRDDNRPENLRLASHAQNAANVRTTIGRGRSGVRGVQVISNRSKPFIAIVGSGRQGSSRSFKTKEEAAAWVGQERSRIYGQFAPQL